MGDSRVPSSIGRGAATCHVPDGTSVRKNSSNPGATGGEGTNAAQDVLARIKSWRDMADFTGIYPNAVKALDHYLGCSGNFVEIPDSKVQSVRNQAEGDHVEKAIKAFKKTAILEAGLAWHKVNGLNGEGTQLSPESVEFTMQWQSGKSGAGVTDDNLTYYGSTILSEVKFSASQATSESEGEGSVVVRFEVVEWKSWVVDNYDWEGDKQFGVFVYLGLPTQREMNSLNSHGLAKSYQRSSHSWINETHGLEPWTDFAASKVLLKEAGIARQQTLQDRQEQRVKDQEKGALPNPRPAEDMRCR